MSSSRFISQEQAEAARKRRQEEWEKVRARDPAAAGAAPEAVALAADGRPLWERLRERKVLKEEQFAEMTRPANLVHRIDEAEASFLEEMQSELQSQQREKESREQQDLEEYRARVAELARASAAAAVDPNEIAPELISAAATVMVAAASSSSSASVSLSSTSLSSSSSSQSAPGASGATPSSTKRDYQKSLLAGAIVTKKKAKLDITTPTKDGQVESPAKDLTSAPTATVDKVKPSLISKTSASVSTTSTSTSTNLSSTTESQKSVQTNTTTVPKGIAALTAYDDEDGDEDDR